VTGDFLVVGPSLFAAPLKPARVVGNLPYNVSSAILLCLIDVAASTRGVLDATLMLQREVAERVAAPEGSKTYGTLSVLASLASEVDWLLDVPPGAFRPPPKVHSAVIRLRFRGDAPALPASFGGLLKGLFGHRRKTMANALRSTYPRVPARVLMDALDRAGIDASLRPESIPPVGFLRLFDGLEHLVACRIR
jgi:16S rRNA (adenine1518-N6/adenine1519-N6)-dimethyltransferase